MALPPGPGPVFFYEWLTTTRRWQLYANRAGFVAIILVGMIVVWESTRPSVIAGQQASFQMMARYGENFFRTAVLIELTLVLLAAPAATAGAVCLDKARGTLDHMLATDLSNAEIVLGKLGVRLVPVLSLIACVLPIMTLGSLLGGIDPLAITGSFLTAIGCAFFGCTLAFLLSVWGRKTHEVLMLAYLLLMFWISLPGILGLIWYSIYSTPPPSHLETISNLTNPYFLSFAPYNQPGTVGLEIYLLFMTVCFGLSGLFATLAIWQIRTVALRHLGPAASPKSGGSWKKLIRRPAWWPIIAIAGPSLDGNPVLWREWHRARPSRMLRIVWVLYGGMGLVWAILSLGESLSTSAGGIGQSFAFMNVFQVAVGLLLLSVSATTSLAEERVRGSLDVLLATPIETCAVVIGKWWGAFRQTPYLLFWVALISVFPAVDSGRWLEFLLLLALIGSYCAVVTSLGLAIATWVSRLGRAVALSVGAYVLFLIGWPAVCFLMMRGQMDDFVMPLVMGSPFYGTIFDSFLLARSIPQLPSGGTRAVIAGTTVWTLINSGIAAALLAATLHTFDRCLGRATYHARYLVPRLRPKPIVRLEPEV